jgi:2,3-dihydroxybenzoate decarboxylase
MLDRFRGFACIALQDEELAGAELKRCIQELGFVGVLINRCTNGSS